MDATSENKPIRLQVVIPFHQPQRCTRAELDEAWSLTYGPLLDAVEANSNVRLALHFSGNLLVYLAQCREETLFRIKGLVHESRVEILGGLFNGGLPALLPELDVRGQVEMAAEFWEGYLGASPQGFWISELAWCPELPRLLQETGLEFGYVSNSQTANREALDRGIGVVERGAQTMPAFVLDDTLSGALPGRPVDEWVDGVLDRASGGRAQGVTTVWVRAESLGLDPGTERWCHRGGWLGQWLAALGGGRPELSTGLPSDLIGIVRPGVPLRVDERCAPELGALAVGTGPTRWSDFPELIPEVDTLHRRLLAVSDKLREAIATMEDEELDDKWSDQLATAQRLVFSAQAPDAYWRGADAGFSDPRNRSAAMRPIIQADALLDGLMQGEDDWLSIEESDRDGDFLEETFVSNRFLGAWIASNRGGQVRALDDRSGLYTVFDVPTRRKEAFFEAMRRAPVFGEATDHDVPLPRGQGLERMGDDLPEEVDSHPRRGIRDLVLEGRTTAQELFSGSAFDLLPRDIDWEIVTEGVDEEGDYAYQLALKSRFALPGANARTLQWEKEVRIPIDAGHLILEHRLALEGAPAVLFATEMPLRLGAGPHKVLVAGKPVDLGQPLADVESLRVETEEHAIEIHLQPAVHLWCLPVATTVRDLNGYRAVDQGLVLVPTVSVPSAQECTMRIELQLESRSE